jgi:hypothetical protein
LQQLYHVGYKKEVQELLRCRPPTISILELRNTMQDYGVKEEFTAWLKLEKSCC